jgi:hypothetical protein
MLPSPPQPTTFSGKTYFLELFFLSSFKTFITLGIISPAFSIITVSPILTSSLSISSKL